jgi:hypothetical protein
MCNSTIPVQIRGKSFRALLDSGANHSVTSVEFLRRLKIPVQNLTDNNSMRITVADGRSITVLGKAELSVKVHGLTMPCEVLVLSQIGHNTLILGLDFLEKNKAKIDFENKIVTFFDSLTAVSLVTCQPSRLTNSVCTMQATILHTNPYMYASGHQPFFC